MEKIAARLRRQRMDEQAALRLVRGRDELRNRFELLARLFFGPERGALGNLFQVEEVVGSGMTGGARRVASAFFHENRLDLGLEELVIESGRAYLRRTHCCRGSSQRDHGREYNSQ